MTIDKGESVESNEGIGRTEAITLVVARTETRKNSDMIVIQQVIARMKLS